MNKFKQIGIHLSRQEYILADRNTFQQTGIYSSRQEYILEDGNAFQQLGIHFRLYSSKQEQNLTGRNRYYMRQKYISADRNLADTILAERNKFQEIEIHTSRQNTYYQLQYRQQYILPDRNLSINVGEQIQPTLPVQIDKYHFIKIKFVNNYKFSIHKLKALFQKVFPILREFNFN